MINFDTYSLRARLLPVLVVILPGALCSIAWIPETKTLWGDLSWLVLTCGVPALLAQFGRGWGRNKQPQLWAEWGGAPTTRFLRHREAANPLILERRHKVLQRLLPELDIPSAEDEAQDPKKADQVYEACAEYLRNNTRDKTQFALLFSENCSYGFRRNLWGMKPLGLLVASASAVGIGGLIAKLILVSTSPGPLVWVCGAFSIMLLVMWLFLVTPGWVKVQAEVYAETLLGACDVL